MPNGRTSKGGRNSKTTTPPAPSTRTTRSKANHTTKAVNTANPKSTEPAADSAHPNVEKQKRKRALTNVSEHGGGVMPQKRPHISSSPNPASNEPNGEEDLVEDTVAERPARAAPVRPRFSSHLGSDEEEDFQESDGPISSDEEPVTLTAKQINNERPISVHDRGVVAGANTEGNATAHGSTGTGKGKAGKRTKRILDEVPSVVQLAPLPVEDSSSGVTLNTTPVVIPPVPVPTSAAAPPVVLPLNPAQAIIPAPLPQPGRIWSAATDLVAGDNGQLQQSAQSADISKCISKAIRLANSNLFFLNAYPNLQAQTEWLSQSLVAVLQDQAQTDLVVREMNLRAQQDNRYMSALVSMMTGRWSNARKGVIDAVRAHIASAACTYGISELKESTDKAAAVRKLLEDEAFHFGKATSGTANKAAPYQHPEISSCLFHIFFNPRNDFAAKFPDRFHRGKYGLQMPQAMVALIATVIQAALEEWKTGVQVKQAFTETDNREPYRQHLAEMQSVRNSKNGESKYERLMSKIYIQTMEHLDGDNPPIIPAPEKKSLIDTDGMEE